MSGSNDKPSAPQGRDDDALDEEIADTFPASDPASGTMPGSDKVTQAGTRAQEEGKHGGGTEGDAKGRPSDDRNSFETTASRVDKS